MRQIDLESMTISSSASELILDFSCSSQDMLFFNGYQTWTTSHEVFPYETFIN